MARFRLSHFIFIHPSPYRADPVLVPLTFHTVNGQVIPLS